MARFRDDLWNLSTEGASKLKGLQLCIKHGYGFVSPVEQIIFIAHQWDKFSQYEKKCIVKYFRALPGIALTVARIISQLP